LVVEAVVATVAVKDVALDSVTAENARSLSLETMLALPPSWAKPTPSTVMVGVAAVPSPKLIGAYTLVVAAASVVVAPLTSVTVSDVLPVLATPT
jgi:hypothetical protein